MSLPPSVPSKSYLINDHLILGGIVNPPYLYECAVYNESFCPKPGIEFEFVRFLAQLLNFTFDLFETHIPQHNLSGTTAQMLEDVRRGDINMSLSFLTITDGDGLDYSQPLMYYRKGFLIQTPSSQKIEFLLTLPFGPYFWTCILTVVPLFFVTLTIMSKAVEDHGKHSNLSHNAWTIFGSVVKPVNSLRTKPRTANRCLLLTWQLGKTIFLSLYSASLVGFLFSKQNPALPFTSLSELVTGIEEKKFQLIQVKGEDPLVDSASNESLKSVVEAQGFLAADFRQRLSDALLANPPLILNSTSSAVRTAAATRGTVFGGFNTNLHIWTRIYNVCHVTVIDDEEDELSLMALAFRRGFVYTEQIKRVANSEYMGKLVRKYVSDEQGYYCRELEMEMASKRLMPLSILQMQGSFWILIGGAVGGGFAILLECIRSCGGEEEWPE